MKTQPISPRRGNRPRIAFQRIGIFAYTTFTPKALFRPTAEVPRGFLAVWPKSPSAGHQKPVAKPTDANRMRPQRAVNQSRRSFSSASNYPFPQSPNGTPTRRPRPSNVYPTFYPQNTSQMQCQFK